MSEIPPQNQEALTRIYAEHVGQKITPERDSLLVWALLELHDSTVNENLVTLFDEEFSPATLDSLKANPEEMLEVFQGTDPDEYTKTRSYGFAGAVMGWLESLLTEK